MNAVPNKKVLVLILTLVLVLSMPLLVKSSRTASAQDAGNGKIVFLTNRHGESDLYVMNTNGSNQTRLTFSLTGQGHGSPSWSHDGSKIVFQKGGVGVGASQIFVMNADGTNPIQITHEPAVEHVYPGLSPDGTKVVFRTNRDGNHEIYVMNIDGSNLTNLTNSLSLDTQPQWSPDSTKIVFMSNRDGNHELYTMNANGTNVIRLTNLVAVEEEPAWSPDGTKIAFISNRSGRYNLYTMNSDGSNQTRITYTSGDDEYPSWSPDGNQIVFSSSRGSDMEIYVMDANGGNEINISNTPGFNDLQPVWQPSGQPTTETGCSVEAPADVYQGDPFTLTLGCEGISSSVFGFQVGHEITAGTGLVTPQGSNYTTGNIFQGQPTLIGSNTLSLYALSLQAGGIQATGDFTLGSVDYTAVAPGQATFDLINLILGDINGEAIAGVQAASSAVTVTIEDLILSLSGSVDPQGYAHADSLTLELEGSPVYANFTKTFVPADGTTDFSYTNIKGHSDWLQVDGPSHATCRELLTFPADAGNETLPSDLILRAGDVNDDDAIDLTDATAIGQQYGQPASGELDINNDGAINILDLIHVGRNYNTVGPTDCTP